MPERKATVKFETDVIFENKHFTEHMNCRRAYKVRTPAPRNPDLNVEDMGAVALALEGIISDAINEGATLRPAGGAWSLSDVAFSGDWLLDTLSMNLKWRMKRNQVRDDYPRDFDKLYLFQCGNSIQEVNERLESDGNSLSTCGASNGQTIAGAISTGVHGSALDVGSIQDSVVGIQLITGPLPQNVIYLERESRPALTKSFAQSINSKLIRNDRLFNAALVSLGSFGVIHGVVMEAEDIFLLKRYVTKIKKAEALEIASSMDFTNATFFPTNTGSTGGIELLAISGLAGTATVLPTRFTNFDAVENNDIVNLKWTVENETGLSKYEVERSIDGTNFIKVNEIKSGGIKNYTLPDDISSVSAAQIYYRIKQYEVNGSYYYSKTISVRRNKNSSVILYPNPAIKALYVNINIG